MKFPFVELLKISGKVGVDVGMTYMYNFLSSYELRLIILGYIFTERNK